MFFTFLDLIEPAHNIAKPHCMRKIIDPQTRESVTHVMAQWVSLKKVIKNESIWTKDLQKISIASLSAGGIGLILNNSFYEIYISIYKLLRDTNSWCLTQKIPKKRTLSSFSLFFRGELEFGTFDLWSLLVPLGGFTFSFTLSSSWSTTTQYSVHTYYLDVEFGVGCTFAFLHSSNTLF